MDRHRHELRLGHEQEPDTKTNTPTNMMDKDMDTVTDMVHAWTYIAQKSNTTRFQVF
jgi:hypothetical protein